MPETCRFSCQNKFVKLVHLFGFITKKFWHEFCYIAAPVVDHQIKENVDYEEFHNGILHLI